MYHYLGFQMPFASHTKGVKSTDQLPTTNCSDFSPSSTIQSKVHKPLILQAGQAMTEYIIIVALVAVAAIAVYQLFGQVVRSQTAAMAKELAGEDGTAQSQQAQSAAEMSEAQTSAKSLKSFTGNAAAGGQ